MENFNNHNRENREKQADLLLRFLNNLDNVESFSKKNFKETFSNEENKREFIKNLSKKEFDELLNALNGIMRNKKKEDWKIDGENVEIASERMVSYTPPEENDKLELLQKVFENIKNMNDENRSLEDMALLLSSSINALHLYSDGNGRLSRFLYTILTKNYNDETKKELQEILSGNGRKKIDISTVHIMPEIEFKIEETELENTDKINQIDNFYSKTSSDFMVFPNIEKKDKELFLKLLDSSKNNLKLAILRFFKNKENFKIENYIKKLGQAICIDLDYLLKDLNSDDFKEILENCKNIKKERVEKMIDIIVNPEKEENQKTQDGNQVSLKKIFEDKIKK